MRSRRAFATLLPVLPLAAWLPLRAQAPAPRKYATMSLVGDQFTVVERREVTGTRIDRNGVAEVRIGSNVMDRAVLGVVNDLIVKADPQAKPLSLLVDEPVLYEKQAQLFDGKFVRLPSALIKVAKDGGATHVLLVSKQIQRFAFTMLHSNPGQGEGEGLGFYVEPFMWVRSVETGEVAEGFLGLFAHLRATIVELATETIVADRPMVGNDLYLAIGKAPGAVPWDSLTANDKVKAIANLAMATVRKNLPPVLAAF
jgi:hypothetical protein